MLAAGHRPIRIERTTLLVWGLATGGLCATLEDLLQRLAGRDVPLMAAWTAAIILGVGALAAWIDRRWLMRHRAERGETINFVEVQLGKAWAMLFVLGTMLTFGTFFFGGQYMVYGFWLVLLGVGLFLHALFSRQLPLWAGIAFIGLGIAPLAAHASYFEMRWIAASALGIGLPLLGVLIREPGPDEDAGWANSAAWWKPAAWLATVVGVATLAAGHPAMPADADVPVVSFDRWASARGTRGPLIVRIPAGTKIPLDLDVGGGAFTSAPGASVELRIAQDLDLLTEDGVATEWSRTAGQWHRGVVAIERLRVHPVTDENRVRLRAEVATGWLRLR